MGVINSKQQNAQTSLITYSSKTSYGGCSEAFNCMQYSVNFGLQYWSETASLNLKSYIHAEQVERCNVCVDSSMCGWLILPPLVAFIITIIEIIIAEIRITNNSWWSCNFINNYYSGETRVVSNVNAASDGKVVANDCDVLYGYR